MSDPRLTDEVVIEWMMAAVSDEIVTLAKANGRICELGQALLETRTALASQDEEREEAS